MKTFILLTVFCITSYTFGANISITSEGVIQLTTVAGENVRGLAIVVESENPITAVSNGDPVFNVFMDQAYSDVTGGPGILVVGEGTPVANPDARGTLDISGGTTTKISLCMGVLDETGNQAAVPAGTVDVATINTTGMVTITLDTLRGGVVGDAVDEVIIEDGEIEPPICIGDIAGNWGAPGTNNKVDVFDLTAMVGYIIGSPDTDFYSMPATGAYRAGDMVGDWGAPGSNGKVDIFDLTAMVGYISTSLDDSFYTMPCGTWW